MTPHVFPRLSTALSTGPFDLGHRPGLASQPGVPGSQAAVTSGEGGDRPAREPAASCQPGSPPGSPYITCRYHAAPRGRHFRKQIHSAVDAYMLAPGSHFRPGIPAHFRAAGTARIPGPRRRRSRRCRHSRPRLPAVNQPECQSAASLCYAIYQGRGSRAGPPGPVEQAQRKNPSGSRSKKTTA
jgi:hypothetical protein